MAQFQPGASGNPAGRPKGAVGGRSLALATLDKMLARASNRAALEKALQRNFRDDPVKFFRTMVMPLMPKEATGWSGRRRFPGPARVDQGQSLENGDKL